MDTEQREALAGKIHNAAKNGQQKLLLFLASREEDFNRHKYAFKVRAKKKTGLVNKTLRKMNDKKDYEVYKITDPLGLRVVSLFRHDLPYYLDKILGYFSEVGEELENNPFVFESINEIIIYTNEKDGAEVKKLKAICRLNSYELKDEDIKKTEQDYSSIHIVGRVNERINCRTLDVPKEYKNYDLPIEIQLRTVFEDAWGEIDHLLKYKSDSEKELLSSKFLSEHIMSLKKFTDACANYADLINHESMKGSTKGSSSYIYDSIECNNAVQKVLESSSVSKHISSYICECRKNHTRYREEAESIQLKGGSGIGSLTSIKNHLSELSNRIYEFCKENKEQLCEVSRYHLLMEEAHIRLNLGKSSELIKALSLYNYIERDCRDKCAVYYRKGLVYLKLDMFFEADKSFSKAKDLAGGQRGSDSSVTKDYVLAALPIQRGLAYYNRSMTEKEEVKVELLKSAIEETKSGLKMSANLNNPRKELVLNNNILYYISNLLDVDKKCLTDELIKIRDEALKFMMEKVDQSETNSVRHIDTLSYALKQKSDIETAQKYATRAIHKIQEKHASGNNLTSEDIDIWLSNDAIIKTHL